MDDKTHVSRRPEWVITHTGMTPRSLGSIKFIDKESPPKVFR